MPYMIFSKDNSRRALHHVLHYGTINDEYPLYEMALDLVIKNTELRTCDMNFGFELNKWSFEELSELIERLTE